MNEKNKISKSDSIINLIVGFILALSALIGVIITLYDQNYIAENSAVCVVISSISSAIFGGIINSYFQKKEDDL